jgi:hypothetical protein
MASRLNNPKSPRVTTPTPPHQANSSPYRTPRNVASAAIKPVLKSSHQVVRNTNRLDREDDCYADLHPGITVTVKFFSARFCGREPFAVIRQRDRSDHDYADIGHFPDLGQQLTWRLWWEHTAMLVEEAHGSAERRRLCQSWQDLRVRDDSASRAVCHRLMTKRAYRRVCICQGPV